LKDLFDHIHEFTPGSSWLQGWFEIRARWVAALETDPTFCADDPGTYYHWLHELDEITPTQKKDLQLASEWYLREPVDDNQLVSVVNPSDSASGVPLPREKNLSQVEETLVNALANWLKRFWKWIWSWF
jgi:hypothetical protein